MSRMIATLAPVAGLFLRAHRGRLLIGALLALSTVLSGMALLALSGWFITATAIAGLSVSAAYAFDVFAPAAGIRFLALTRTASRYGERIATHDATLRVLSSLRERLFRNSATPGTARQLLLQPARLLFRLTSDIDALDSLYLRALVPAVVAIVSAVLLAIALSFVDPMLGAGIGLALVIAGTAIPMLAAGRAKAASRRRARAIEVLRTKVIDLVSGRTDLAMTGRLATQEAAVMRVDGLAAREEDRLNRIESVVALAFGAVSACLLAVVLWFVSAAAEDGRISAPVAALVLLAVMAAFEPFAALRRGALEFGRMMLAAHRVGPGLRVEDAADGTPQGGDAGMKLDDVTARYQGADFAALTGISLQMVQGEKLAVIGASGAGKSTLLALLAGELASQEGTISCPSSALMTQRTELFNDTLRDNLLLAALDAGEDDLWHALTQAGLASDVIALPGGLDTVLGEGGQGLSAGQARRLALARLILNGAPLWLLDEPTEGVDGATARDILARLGTIGGSSMVIATHLQREASFADRIVLLEEGRISMTAHREESEFQRLLDRLRPD